MLTMLIDINLSNINFNWNKRELSINSIIYYPNTNSGYSSIFLIYDNE